MAQALLGSHQLGGAQRLQQVARDAANGRHQAQLPDAVRRRWRLALDAAEIDAAFADADFAWEALWVDDGSSDRSLAIIKALATPWRRCATCSRPARRRGPRAARSGRAAARGGRGEVRRRRRDGHVRRRPRSRA